MPQLKATVSYTTPDTPNFPGNTPEAFAIGCKLMQGDVLIASDSIIPPETPHTFIFNAPVGDYTVMSWVAAGDWSPIGPVKSTPASILPDVIRPVISTVVIS